MTSTDMNQGRPAPLLLCTKRAAQMLGLSHRTLEDWRLRGFGPPWRNIGRRVFYLPSDLLEFIEQSIRFNTGQGATT